MMDVIWQLPVKRKGFSDHWIHRGAKYHAFVNNRSICGKYTQNIGFSENRIDEKDIKENPHLACKKCLLFLES